MIYKKNFIPLNLNILSICTLAIIAGIIFKENILFSIIILLFILIYNVKKILLILIIFSTGLLLYQNQLNNFEKFYINSKKIHLLGTIKNIDEHNIKIKIEKIKYSGEWHSQNGQITVKSKIDIEEYDKIKIKNIKIYKPKKKSHAKLQKNNFGIIFLNKNTKIKTIKTNNSIYKKINLYKKGLFNKIEKKLSPKSFNIFSKVFWGKKQNYKEKFIKKWGIQHLFARSGLHLIIFILILQFFLQFLPIPLFYKNIISIFYICLIYIITEQSLSFNRAFWIFIIYSLYKLFDVQRDFINIFTIICLFFLIYNPVNIFCLDFQLSFGLSFILIWANNIKQQAITD